MSPLAWATSPFGIEKPGGTAWWAMLFSRISASLNKIQTAVSGGSLYQGTIGTVLLRVTSSLAATLQPAGTIATQQNTLTTVVAGAQTQLGAIAASLPKMLSSVNATESAVAAVIATSQASPATSLVGSQIQQGIINVVLQNLSSALVGGQAQQGTIAAALQQAITALIGVQELIVTYGATGTTGASNATTNPFTWQHTIGANDNEILIGLGTGSSGLSATAVSVGGVAGTLKQAAVNGVRRAELWVVPRNVATNSPPSGSQTVSVTRTGSGNMSGDSVSYQNVSGLGTAVTATGTSTVPSVTVASDANHRVFAIIAASVTTLSSDNQTERFRSANTATIIEDAPGASSVTLSATYTTSGAWAVVGVDLLN